MLYGIHFTKHLDQHIDGFKISAIQKSTDARQSRQFMICSLLKTLGQ